MSPIALTFKEIRHRWRTSLLFVVINASLIGMLAYFSVNNAGFQKEIGRKARDIGSNVVILPSSADQFEYHSRGGFSDQTMSDKVVDQLVEYKASLNHLIPMLERKATCVFQDQESNARVVGIAASIPVPGRPKSPMQKAIEPGKLQLGSAVAETLGIARDFNAAQVSIEGQPFEVGRVNRANGTWQDAAILMDLKTTQELFGLPGQISRIEAIECTQEQCAETGLKSDVVLTNELARITDEAVLLRREKMADARSSIRVLGKDSLVLIQRALWNLLAIAIVGITGLNTFQRRSEIGVLQAVGYGQSNVAWIFVLRSVLLTTIAAVLGVLIAASVSFYQSKALFAATGNKFTVDWGSLSNIGILAILIAAAASLLPAVVAATSNPAELIGRDR